MRPDPERRRGRPRQCRPHRHCSQDRRSKEQIDARRCSTWRVAPLRTGAEDRPSRYWPCRLSSLPAQWLHRRSRHGRRADQKIAHRQDRNIHHLPDARRRDWFPHEPCRLWRRLRQIALAAPSHLFPGNQFLRLLGLVLSQRAPISALKLSGEQVKSALAVGKLTFGWRGLELDQALAELRQKAYVIGHRRPMSPWIQVYLR